MGLRMMVRVVQTAQQIMVLALPHLLIQAAEEEAAAVALAVAPLAEEAVVVPSPATWTGAVQNGHHAKMDGRQENVLL